MRSHIFKPLTLRERYDKRSVGSMRKTPIVTEKIYHVFNRGVNKGRIFFEENDYRRFVDVLRHYKYRTNKYSYEKYFSIRNPSSNAPGASEVIADHRRVEILAYCLMPNHVHLLIKQVVDFGLTSFMHQLFNSYSHYINVKYKRSGPVVEGRFKNVLVDSDEQLVHVSRYIHLNPIVSGLSSKIDDYEWSSFIAYVSGGSDIVVDCSQILGYFKSTDDYKIFVKDQISYGKELEKVKHLAID